jgi:alpha-1,3-rhamnosyl/mannosyltransferase
MRIALDARTVSRHERRGIGKSLLALYAQVAALRPDWRVTAYHREADPADLGWPADFVQRRRVEIVGDRFDAWQRWRLPWAAWRDEADLLHCPANHCPAWMPTPTLVTIHDLIPLDLPHGRPTQEVRRFEQSVRQACQRATWITTPSEYVRGRLIGEFDADPARLTVVPWAPLTFDEALLPQARVSDDTTGETSIDLTHVAAVAQRYRMNEQTVLHLGAGDPRKNTRRLIEAWAMIRKQHRKAWKLIIVGLDPRTQTDLLRSVSRLGLEQSVFLHGYVEERDLGVMFTLATVLAYPSLSEGFGLPLLDAFASDTAVLTSPRTSLPEVAGEAAHLVDPTDACSIAGGLSKLLRDRVYREHLVQRGRERLGAFTWENTATKFIAAVEQAADLGSGTRLPQAA